MNVSERAGAPPFPPGTALLVVVACAVFELVGGILLVLLMVWSVVEPDRWLLYSATLVVIAAGAAVAGILVEARLRTID